MCLAALSFAPTTQANEKITYETTKLGEHAYVITRSWDSAGKFRTNVGVIIGEAGITLINPLFARNADQLMAEVGKVSEKPIRYVINSNWDTHNTDANAHFRDRGATIISHRNTKYFENTITGITFENELELELGTETIVAYRSYGHSMGHINIFLKNTNAIFMSDSYRDQWMTTPGPYGNSGHLRGLASALALANDDTIIVPGNTSANVHGYKKDLLKAVELRTSFIARVLALTAEGQNPEEISQDAFIQTLFKDNYERYPEYGKDINFVVRAALYGERLKNSNMSSDEQAAYVGTYELPNGKLVEVLQEGRHLFARSEGLFYYLLAPRAKDQFEISWTRDRTISFTRDDAGNIQGFRVNMAADDERYGQEQILKYLRTVDLVKKIDAVE